MKLITFVAVLSSVKRVVQN